MAVQAMHFRKGIDRLSRICWDVHGNVKVEMVGIVTPEDVEIRVRPFGWVPAKGHLFGGAHMR